MAQSPPPFQFIDIGSNLSDPVFRGVYGERQIHEDDFLSILSRANEAGVVKQVLTGDCLTGSMAVIDLAKKYDGLFCTVGCHPCRAQEFESFEGGPDAYIATLDALIAENISSGKVVAIGECGLDYDRLELCPKEVQLKYFPLQLQLANKFDLPLFLHCRESQAHQDFVAIIKDYKSKNPQLRGVVHSHTGTLEEALEMINLGFYIGINGCSLKTAENVECVRQLPLSSILIESDCPWCEIRPSHASYPFLATLSPDEQALYRPTAMKKEKFVSGKMVKGRNEPVATALVAHVISQLKGIDMQQVSETCYMNSVNLFEI